MSVLVVDTETTGLRAAEGGAGRLVQLAWVRLDGDGREVEARSVLVRPDGFEIPPEATAVHRITTARARAEGIPLAHALAALAEAAAGVQGVVAHNADFDRAVLAAEAGRLGIPDPLGGRGWTCTMRAGAPVCRIPRPGGWKVPTLEELHRHLFGTAFDGAHDALADARAAARCYARLREAGALEGSERPSAPPPTAEQARALEALERFMDSRRAAFVLLGAAGTGKTTLLAHVAALAETRGRTVRLLAPTGRAARVAARHARREAQTIHSHLYSYQEMQAEGDDPEATVALVFGLRENDGPPGTLYLVDEASMVSDTKEAEEGGLLRFGSGRLLSDLVRFAALHDRERGHQVVFVGDPAQLPPVGSPDSPALSARALAERHGLDAEAFELTEVLRQRSGSGILASAHRIRRQIGAGDFASLALKEEAPDVEEVPPDGAVATYLRAVEAGGLDAAILIARTNRTAAALNAAVRRAWLGEVPGLVAGDRLIVVQNNPLHRLYNGDFVEVVAVSERVERRRPLKGVGLTWREVTVREASSGREVTALLMDDLVTSDAGNLTHQEVQALVVDFRQRHPHLKPKTRPFEEALRRDPYVHALRARHGYALTCHKAQGGEWPTAIVVFDGREKGWANEDYFRWTYTAITRAKGRLVAVRPPRHTATSGVAWADTSGPASTGAAPAAPAASANVGALLAGAALSVSSAQDRPYCRRLTLTRAGVVGRVDVFYDGKRVVKSVQPLGSGPGGELSAEAAALLAPLVGTVLDGAGAAGEAGRPRAFEPPDGFFDEHPHLADLFERFQRALAGTGITVEDVSHHQWMERYTFRRGGERAEINVYYNAKGRFTKALAVRPSALAEEVRTRWSAT